ncbi:MAG: tetratricopeptide repeat protein, partial [Gemmataceae bacterium]
RPAIHGLSRYLTLHPGDLQALLARAHVWERFLYFTDALEDYRAAVAAHPENEQARLKAGQGELKAGTPAAALEHFTWLAQQHPEQPAVRLGLARCRRALGEPGQARETLERLLQDYPRDAEGLLERGLLEMDGGNADQAEPWLRRAIALQPHDRRFVHALERCCLAKGNKEEASQLKERVVRIDSDLSKLDPLLLAVMKSPRDAKLRCEAAKIFLRNGEREEARKWLRLALRMDPTFQEAQDLLKTSEMEHPSAP